MIGSSLALKSQTKSVNTIYADYNGSAPICPSVRDFLHQRLSEGPFANPNASHQQGQKTLMQMENSRAQCAQILGAKYNQVFFNSGSSEGISTIFHSLLGNAQKDGKTLFAYSILEHPAVLQCSEYYQSQGLEAYQVPILNNGLVDLKELEKWLSHHHKNIAMVCLMAAHNETGVVQPYVEIAQLCQSFHVPYFCDTTQIIGKAPFDFEQSGIDFAVLSGHKFGALTGTGILLAKDSSSLRPLILGGGQESGLRGGTQNYIGYETLAVALLQNQKSQQNIQELQKKRLEFESKIKQEFPQVFIVGENSPRLATTTYISYPGIPGRDVQEMLERKSIFVTTSSACCDKTQKISPVLKAMKIPEEIAEGVVRISLGLSSQPETYDRLFDALSDVYQKLS